MKTSNPDLVLLDTNVLIYAHDEGAPNHKVAAKIRKESIDGKIKASIAPQNLLEFYSITTNAKRVKNPFTTSEAYQIIDDYLFAGRFQIIIPTVETIFTFSQLLKRYRQKLHPGAHIFDVFLAATAISAGIYTIFTENVDDFAFSKDLKVINPFLR